MGFYEKLSRDMDELRKKISAIEARQRIHAKLLQLRVRLLAAYRLRVFRWN